MSEQLKILYVEDDPADFLFCSEAVAEYPISVELAGSLAEARRVLEAQTFDCAWVDLHLPDGDGIELVRELSRASEPRTPSLVLTGLDDEKAGIRAVKVGAQDYLVKGRFDGSGLAASTRYAVERSRTSRLRQQLLAQEKIIEFGHLAAGAAQRLYNPITSIFVNQRVVAEGVSDLCRTSLMEDERGDELMGALDDISSAAHQVVQLVHCLEAFSRVPEAPTLVNMNETIRSVTRSLDITSAPITTFLGKDAVVRAVAADIELVVRTLMTNALQHGQGAPVRIITRVSGQHQTLVVEDDGPGVARHLKDEVFAPFFSTDAASDGVGLALASNVVSRMDGTISLDSLAGPTRFVVSLPRMSGREKALTALQTFGQTGRNRPDRAPPGSTNPDREGGRARANLRLVP